MHPDLINVVSNNNFLIFWPRLFPFWIPTYPQNPKICDPILVTVLKMRPHYSQWSRENAIPSSGTSLLASCKGVPPPPPWIKASMSGLFMFLGQNYRLCGVSKLLGERRFCLELLFQYVPWKCWQRKLLSMCPWQYHGFVLSIELEIIFFEY